MSQTQGGLSLCSRSPFSGSGALSHVYLQYPPLRCSIPGIKGLHYDDGNRLLLASTSNQIFSWQVSQFTPADIPNAFTIAEGPVLSVKVSLDGKIMALQRSEQEVEFVNLETANVFMHQCRAEAEKILGFFWTDCPTCDIVFVKTCGLELYSLQTATNCLKFVEAKRFNVNWYVYTHESRLVLLASGMQNKSLFGFQFSVGGIIRLPKFEATMTKSETNKKPVLVQEDVYIATMYGRIYCLQVDKEGMQLIIFRFYRDAVVNQGSLPIYSNKVAISVVDNVLLVHQVDAKVVLLYDIYADSKAPISAPLPLLVRGPSGSVIVSSRKKDRSSGGNSSPLGQSGTTTTGDVSVYGDGWVFLNPDLICDNIHGFLWRINLDLEAITASSSEVPSLLGFLQRRKLEADKAKQLSLAVMRSILLERRPLSLVVSAIDIITFSYAHAMRLASSLPVSSEPLSANKNISRKLSTSNVNGKSKELKSDGESSGRHLIIDPERRTGLEAGVVEVKKDASVGVSSVLGKPSDASDDVNSITNVNSGTLSSGLEDASSSSSHGTGLDYNHQLISQSGVVKSSATILNRPRIASTMISPDEMYKNVFGNVEEEMSADPMYLVGVIVEYLCSAAAENVEVPTGLHVLLVQLLARNEHYAQLEQFVINKVLEPSKEVAVQLVEVGTYHLPARKLGMEMLRQLSCHNDYVLLLLRDGRFIEALRYVRRNKVLLIPPVQFLETALATKDAQKLAAVLRFCQDFVPNFEHTSDYARYCTILKDMNSLVID